MAISHNARRATALGLGIFYLASGILPLFPLFVGEPGPEAPGVRVHHGYGNFLGIFPTNLVHNLAHIAVGIWGVVAWSSSVAAKLYLRVIAVIFLGLAALGLFPGANTLFGLAPIFGNDVWLHATLGAIAAWFGWARSRAEPQPSA